MRPWRHRQSRRRVRASAASASGRARRADWNGSPRKRPAKLSGIWVWSQNHFDAVVLAFTCGMCVRR
eukprot:3262635-Prymnesium_polylepis.1